MTFYTSYFANIKALPEGTTPVSICAKVPDWYTGLQYKKLAPKYEFFMEWKRNHDNAFYVKCYTEQVLSKLRQSDVVLELCELVKGSIGMYTDIALICYEKPTDFCHRHLVAEWFRKYGYACTEWRN